jgi:sulfite reductase (ferredoxin)
VGKHQAVARAVGYRCPAGEVPDAIERLLRAYLAESPAGDNFRQFCARHTDEELRTILAGSAVPAEARDPSPGRPPHGVEG